MEFKGWLAIHEMYRVDLLTLLSWRLLFAMLRDLREEETHDVVNSQYSRVICSLTMNTPTSTRPSISTYQPVCQLSKLWGTCRHTIFYLEQNHHANQVDPTTRNEEASPTNIETATEVPQDRPSSFPSYTLFSIFTDGGWGSFATELLSKLIVCWKSSGIPWSCCRKYPRQTALEDPIGKHLPWNRCCFLHGWRSGTLYTFPD